MAKRRNGGNYQHYVILGILISLTLVFFSFNYRLRKERQGNKERVEELEAELKRVEDRKDVLREGLDEVDDREYIERILREDFLMKKPGEEAVIILTEDEKEGEEGEVVNVDEEKDETREGFWNRLPFRSE